MAGSLPCCLLQGHWGLPVLALSPHILKVAEAVLCLCPVTHEETVRVMEMLTLTVGQAYHILRRNRDQNSVILAAVTRAFLRETDQIDSNMALYNTLGSCEKE